MLEELIKLIKKSFLIENDKKEELINVIYEKDDIFKENLLELLKNEKQLIIQSLKEYKNRANTDIWMIKQELIQKNLRRIKNLENEEKNDNLEIDFWNIF